MRPPGTSEKSPVHPKKPPLRFRFASTKSPLIVQRATGELKPKSMEGLDLERLCNVAISHTVVYLLLSWSVELSIASRPFDHSS